MATIAPEPTTDACTTVQPQSLSNSGALWNGMRPIPSNEELFGSVIDRLR